MLAALLQTAGQQKSQLVDQILTPRSKISQNPKNGGTRAHGLAGWYELNPQARAGEGYAQEQARVRNENFRAGLPKGGGSPQASATPAAAAAPVAGKDQGGFWSFMEKALKLGSKHEQKANEPRINKLTGLPFGTQPGDPAYQDQLVKDAPKSIPIDPFSGYSQTGKDALNLGKQIQAPGGALANLQAAQNGLRARDAVPGIPQLLGKADKWQAPLQIPGYTPPQPKVAVTPITAATPTRHPRFKADGSYYDSPPEYQYTFDTFKNSPGGKGLMKLMEMLYPSNAPR